MKQLKWILGLTLMCVAQIASAQYYSPALGLNGQPLKSALHNIITNHYAQAWPLWSFFPATDTKAGNIVWDIYSDVPGGTPPYTLEFVTSQCGTYNAEGDCFNHEHTWPSTFFNDATPMRTDLQHVLPTDGYVNNKRSNLPYGKANTTSWSGQNGSKIGFSTTYNGYTDKVFEPIDSFKGDVARIYFYMSTRYQGEDAGWSNWTMAYGAELTQDAINLLLDWHHNDPVSQKEINRNNAIYLIQNNRNPFIDYPIFADCIWGTTDCTPLKIDEQQLAMQIQLFPNPAQNILHIQTNHPSEIQTIKVYSLMGKYIQSFESNNMNIEHLQAGNYILRVQFKDGIANKLFTKE